MKFQCISKKFQLFALFMIDFDQRWGRSPRTLVEIHHKKERRKNCINVYFK